MFSPFIFRDNFYQFGEIRTITLVPRQQCGFVQYTKRAAAELAAEKTFNKLVLGGRKLTIKWAHSQAKQNAVAKTNRSFEAVPGLPTHLPMPPNPNDYFNLTASDVNVLPAGMKLHQIPPSLMSSSAYQALYQSGGLAPYNAPFSSIPATSTSASELQQMPAPPGASALHYPSQDPNRLGAVKK